MIQCAKWVHRTIKYYLAVLSMIFISLTFSINTEAQLSNLIIEKDEILMIPPRLYSYDTIQIKERGKLKVNDNGSRWLILNAKVIICDGTIEYVNFKRGIGLISYTLESGEILQHSFTEGFGGAGGSGSGNSHKQGGLGFRPNDYNGGGGGSGAYYTGNPKVNLSGISATDLRGAPSPGSSQRSYGGNGGRQTFGHGGLVYIIAGKIIFGTSASIQLNGSDGVDGTIGGGGDCYGGGSVYYWGGGGGGGGSAGGNGGVLIVKCKQVTNTPTVNVNPGRGGKGGNGGRSTRCTFHGQNGMRGDDGELGYVDWQ